MSRKLIISVRVSSCQSPILAVRWKVL